jgi:hypothetical protein
VRVVDSRPNAAIHSLFQPTVSIQTAGRDSRVVFTMPRASVTFWRLQRPSALAQPQLRVIRRCQCSRHRLLSRPQSRRSLRRKKSAPRKRGLLLNWREATARSTARGARASPESRATRRSLAMEGALARSRRRPQRRRERRRARLVLFRALTSPGSGRASARGSDTALRSARVRRTASRFRTSSSQWSLGRVPSP